MLLFFFVFKEFHRYKFFILALLLINILLFSFSTTAVAILVVSSILPLLFCLVTRLYGFLSFRLFSIPTKSLKVFCLLSFSLFSIVTVLSQFASMRIFNLIRFLFSRGFDIFSLILVDDSVRDRISHSLFAVISSYKNYFPPQGYSSFLFDFMQASLYFDFGDISIGSRIMTGLGSYMYEYGIFSIFFLIVFGLALFSIKTVCFPFKVFLHSTFLLVGFSTVPPGSSLYASFIGLVFYVSHTSRNSFI